MDLKNFQAEMHIYKESISFKSPKDINKEGEESKENDERKSRKIFYERVFVFRGGCTIGN